MRTRDAVIEYQKTLDNAGTLTKDLDLVDPVSALYLEFEATNGSVSNKANWLSDVITKLEIVDGSQVLYSLNLSQLEALHFYKTGKTPPLFLSEWPDGTQRHGCLLLFGRYLWDEEYAMDFTRFANPQLKITSNLAAITVAGTTGFVSASLKGTVVAKVMENAKKPTQYLMAKEIDSFTMAATGEKRVDLLTDYVYRMLMLRVSQRYSDIDLSITDLKFTCDTDKFIPFNRKVKQLDAEAFAQFGASRLKHDILASYNDEVEILHHKEPDCRVWDEQTVPAGYIAIAYQWSGRLKIRIFAHDGTTITTDRNLTMVEEGHSLHGTLPIPFGIMANPATWFDPKPYKKLELVLSQGAAHPCQICLEQVRPL